MSGGLTTPQQWAFAVAPKPSAVLSLVSSSYVLHSILTSPPRRRRIFHRLVAVMSSWNLLMSVVFFWGTWAIPAGYPIIGAAGTWNTCEAQGFLIQLSLAVPFYYCSLSILAFAAVKNNFDEGKIKCAEPVIHAVVMSVCLGMAIWGLTGGYFNPAGPWCWVGSYPTGCNKPYSNVECARGGDAHGYNMTNLSLIVFMYGLATLMMLAMYVMVWRRERTSAATKVGKKRYEEKFRRKRSLTAARQAGLYLAAFYAVYIFGLITRAIEWVTGNLVFGVLVMSTIMTPLQGYLNMLVYESTRFRPNKRRRSRRPSGNTQHTSADSLAATTMAAAFSERTKAAADGKGGRGGEGAEGTVEDEEDSDGGGFEFSIFDGTNPSDRWARYIDEDDYADEDEEDEEGMGEEEAGEDNDAKVGERQEQPPPTINSEGAAFRDEEDMNEIKEGDKIGAEKDNSGPDAGAVGRSNAGTAATKGGGDRDVDDGTERISSERRISRRQQKTTKGVGAAELGSAAAAESAEYTA